MSQSQSLASGSQFGSQWGSQSASGISSVTAGISGLTSPNALRLRSFAILTQLELNVEKKYAAGRLVIELVQWIALLATSHFPWPPLLKDTIGRVLYALHLPLFDRGWLDFGADANRIIALSIFWVTLVWLAIPVAVCVAALLSESQHLSLRTTWFIKGMVHASGSVLLFPIVGAFMSFMTCDADRVALFWFPDDSCTGALAIVHFVAGCIGLALTALTAYATNALLFDDSHTARRLMARSRPHATEWMAFAKVSFVVCFHLLIAKREQFALALVATCLGLVSCAVTAFLQPFFFVWVSRITCGTFLALAFSSAAAIAAVKSDDKGWLDPWGTLVYLGAAFVGFALGLLAPVVRQNSQMWLDLDVAARGGVVLYPDDVFPDGLPRNDLALSSHATLEHDIYAQEERQLDEDGQVEEATLRICAPFVTRVYIPSDVELSARTLVHFSSALEQRPPDPMVAYASRLFTKGLVRFRLNAALAVDFAHFLITFGRRARLALKEVEGATTLEPSVSSMYRGHKLQSRLKAVLNLSDNTQGKLLGVALRLHKEILSHMALFWSKLLLDSVDTVQLAQIVNTITTRRGLATDQFQRALRNATSTTLIKYARFLEQVMHNAPAARAITQRLAEAEAERQQNKKGSAGEPSYVAASELGQMLELEDQVEDAATGSSTIQRLSFTTHGMFGALVLLLLLFFGYEALRLTLTRKQIDRVSVASEARTVAAQGAFVAEEFVRASASNAASPSAAAAAKAASLQQQLAALAGRFSQAHNRLTYGDLGTTFGPFLDYVQHDRVEVFSPDPVYGFRRGLTNLWDLGGAISNDFVTLSSLSNNTAAAGLTAAQTLAAQKLRLNAAANYPTALNVSLFFHVEEHERVTEYLRWGLIGLLLLSVLAIFTVYSSLVLNFASIGAAKLSILSLFRLIPRVHLERLHGQAKENITQFDTEDAVVAVEAGIDEDDLALGTDAPKSGKRGPSGSGGKPPRPGKRGAGMSAMQQTLLMNWDDEKSAGANDKPGRGSSVSNVGGPVQGRPPGTVESDDDEAAMAGEDIRLDDDEPPPPPPKQRSAFADKLSACMVLMRQYVPLACVFVAMLLMGGAFALVYVAAREVDSLRDDLAERRLRSERAALATQHLTQLSDAAQAFVLTGATDDLRRYSTLFRNTEVQQWHRDAIADERSAARRVLAVRRQTLWDDLQRRQVAAITLACSSRGVSSAEQWAVTTGLAYNFTRVFGAEAPTFAEFSPLPPPLAATDSEADAALSADAQLLVAQSLLFDETYSRHFDLIARARADAAAVADPLEADIADAADAIDGRVPATLVLCAAAAVLVVAYAVTAWRGSSAVANQGPRLWATTTALASSAVVLALLVIAVVGLGVSLWRVQELREDYDDGVALQEAANTTLVEPMTGRRFARSVAVFGNASFYHEYERYVARARWPAAVAAVLTNTFTRRHGAQQSLVQQFAVVRRRAEILAGLDRIAVRLALYSHGHPTTAAAFGTEAGPYARSREADRTADYVTFGVGEWSYTNQTFDSARAPDAQRTIAGATLGADRFRAAQVRFYTAANRVLRALLTGAEESLEDGSRDTDAVTLLVLIAGGAILVVVGGAVLGAVYVTVQSVGSRGVGQYGSHQSSLLAALTVRVRVTLAIVFALFAVCFAVDVFFLATMDRTIHDLATASMREWRAARGGLLAQDIFYRDTYPSRDRAALHDLVVSSMRGALLLYAGHMGDAGYRATGSHHDLLFGAAAHIERRLARDCDVALDLSAGSTLWASTADEHDISWLLLLQRIATTGQNDSLATFTTLVRDRAVPTILALENSTVQFQEEARKQSTMFAAVHFSLAAVALAAVVGLLVFVFRPMIRNLANEDDGAKLLLRMIPQAIVDDVPAIAEYLENGTVTQNERMQRISEAVTEMSTVAFVMINSVGTVSHFSRAASEEFGYEPEEVLGQNVKMLMPEDIARRHDQILVDYRRTGIKHVIDTTRRVRAQRKDGSQFPAEISVREYRKSARESLFLGFIRNVQTTIEFERALKLNEAVSDMAATPVVIMDRLGCIYRVNRAITETFGYDTAGIVGQNIKILMPERIAESHDAYLANYQVTRRKFVVDHSRKVTARKKGGEEFPAMVTVREMCDAEGRTLFFIGYLKDMTKELLFQQSMIANEVVIQISPTPVISINPSGHILLFSPAAANAWGYAPEEVLGKNIKMLMPENVATHHDGYLARYMKTGEKHILDTTREAQARRKDGSVFTVSANIRELRRGDQTTFIGYMADLTDRNRMEDQARVAGATFGASPVPIIVTSDEGMVQQFNPAAERLLGYRLEEMLNQNVKKLTPAEVEPQHDGFLERYRTTGIKTIMDSQRRVEVRHKSGRLIPVELSLREVVMKDIMAPGGVRSSYFGFLRDMTEELKMSQANLLNNAISDLCTVPMIAIEKNGTVLTFNRAAQQTWGYSADHVVGKNIKMLMPDTIARNHDGYLERYNRTGEKHIIDTKRRSQGRRSNGTEFPVELCVKEITKIGLDTMFVGYARDITNDIAVSDAQMAVEKVIDTSPLPIIAIDARGVIQRFSLAAERIFHWPRAEALGKNIKVLMPQDTARQHDGYLRRYMKTGVKTVVDTTRQVTGMRRDGHLFPVELAIKEVRKQRDAPDTDGVPPDTTFLGYVRDLSTEYVLRQSNELRDVVLRASIVPMIQMDTKGTITYCNPECEREFQYAREDLLGANIKMLMPKEISDHHDGYLARYLETREKHVIDSTRTATAQRRDGTRFPIEISVREIHVEGTPHYVGYIRNVEREVEVRDKQRVANSVMERSMIPLVIMSEIGTVEVFNHAACTAFGYQRDEVVGQNVKMLMPEEIAAHHDDYLAGYKRHRVKNVIDSTRAVTARRKNGATFPAEITVKELIDPDTSQSTYVGYIRDTTEETNAQAAQRFADTIAALSPIPLIAMNDVGTVFKFSRAAEEEFAYSEEEVVSQNVKMLMPEDIAVVHDAYLERYRRTGIKRVIGSTRQVRARRRDGTEFPAEISVSEIAKDGLERTLVGFLRSLTADHALEVAQELNTLVTDLIPTPFIAISDVGTIEVVNRALCEAFGFASRELLGQNIKMLMPVAIAVNHDGYLAKYRETGEKHVIDSLRTVPGRRKDGMEFTVELSVRETYNAELERRTFFGFARDLSFDLGLEKQFHLGDAVTNMSLVPLIVIDAQGTVVKFSRAAAQVFGYAAEEVVGQNIKMLVPEPIRTEHDGYLARYMKTKERHVVGKKRKVRGLKKDGGDVSLELNITEITVNGESTFVGFCVDLTDAERTEQEEHLLSVVNDLAAISMVIIDEIGTIQQVNDTALELFGYSRLELVGQNVKMLTPPGIRERHDGYLFAYQRTREKHIIDSSRRATAFCKDGREIAIEIGVTEVHLDGRGTMFLGFIRDITQQVVLEETSRMATAVLSLSTTPLALMDHTGRILQVSRAVETLLGYRPEECVGYNVKKLMPDEIAAKHDGYLARYLETGVKTVIDSTRQVTAQHASGHPVAVTISVRELKATNGDIYFAGIMQPLRS